MRGFLRSKITWTVAALALLVGLYALLGFRVAPELLRTRAVEHAREAYGRELTLGVVRVHPFKLQLELHDLSLPDADGTPMVAFERLFVDFQAFASLRERALVFREVALEAPRVRVVIDPDGAVNLAALAPPDDPDEEDGPPPALWIQSFALDRGAIGLFSQLRRPVERHFAPVTFTLRDFRTTAEGGRFGLTARSQQDEQFEWQGQFALAPIIASTGEFAIRALRAPGVAEFLGDDLPFLLPEGGFDLAGRYSLSVGEQLSLEVAVPTITATGLALRARGETEDWVRVPSLVVSDTKFAVPALELTLGEIAIDGLDARLWRDAEGTLNLERLFAPGAEGPPADPAADGADESTPPAPEAAPEPAPGPVSRREPSLALGRLHLRNATLDFEDRGVQPAARFVLAPLELAVRDLSLDLGRPLPVELRATVNGDAQLAATGSVVPDTGGVDVGLDLQGFALPALQPYANAPTDLRIERGTLGAKGRFTKARPGSGAPELGFAGSVTLRAFRSTDEALEQDFLNFDRLDVEKLRFTLGPDALGIDRVRIVRPFARVIVSSDQVLNVAAVFDPQGTAAALAARRAEAAARDAETARKKSRAEVRAERRAAAAAAKTRAASPAPASPEPRETGMPIRIREVALVGGTVDFADYSVQPNFAAAIQAFEGRVTGLSSDPRSRATVDLSGNVGEFSPVRIEGTTQPFSFDRYTDLGLRFENISLPIFNPYSGRIAGYNIAKGKLTTELHYRIDARRLEAQHRIRIDQLEWGEATAARGEATLPVKFATSLLKDADGVITLDVPVSGTLDDPTFRLGPIVWQVIKNVLSKAVTAPFRALGALFKGAEEAQFVEFAAGEAALEPQVAERLAALGKSLAGKPELRLDVPIGAVAAVDGEAIARLQFDRSVAAAAEALSRRRTRDDERPAPAFDALAPERRLEVLTQAYRSLWGAEPKVPEPPEFPDDLPRKERRARALQATLEWLEAECRKRAQPSPAELDRLGQQRGEAIQAALLRETGMAPERVFLARDGKVTTEGDRVRFELEVR